MAVDSKTTGLQTPASRSTQSGSSGSPSTPTSTPLTKSILAILDTTSPRVVACAPGRLGLLGGSAEYTGSLILNTPLEQHACVGAQRRSDGKVQITSIRAFQDDGHENVVASVSDFASDAMGALLEGIEGCAARSTVAALAEMVDGGVVPLHDGGVTLAVGSTLHDLSEAGEEAAIAVATIVAVAGAFGVELDSYRAVELCQQAQNKWLGLPVGVGDAMCSLLGEPGALLQATSNPCRTDATLAFPDDRALIGLDCGVRHADAMSKYARVRCASFMGRSLIDRIIQHDGLTQLRWDGHLSRISIADYVDRFRDRIPTKLKGSDYLKRFGETSDPLTEVEPDFIYKIRSRTEHHIYEHARACQFVECMSRSIRTRDSAPLQEAGELMYASHWSYGQRCGLGSVETDLLVSHIRRIGVERGVYGAKITGRGCGGTVAVLLKPCDETFAALESVRQFYESKTGNTCRLCTGSSPGALVAGVQRF